MSLAEVITERTEHLESNQGWIGRWINHFQSIHPLFRSGDNRDALKSLTQLQAANAVRIEELINLLKKQ